MILLTGAAGYIGSMCLKVLRKYYQPEQIVAIDNYSYGEVKTIDGVIIHKVDIRDKTKLENYMNNIDVIIHLAGITGIEYCENNPKLTCETNILGTKNLVDLAIDRKVQHFLYSSTSAVYGNAMGDISENTILRPVNFYGLIRKACEDILITANEVHRLNFTIFRQSNIYGKSYVSFKPTLVNIFSNKLLARKNLVVFGTGDQKRNYLHVRDVAEAYAIAIKEKVYGIYNLGGNENLSVNDIAELANKCSLDCMGYKVEIEYNENSISELEVNHENYQYNINNLLSKSSFIPSYSVEDAFHEYFANQTSSVRGV